MPLFVKPRDYLFMQGINQELVDQVIETPVIFFGIDPTMSEPNLYGESTAKVYLPGIECNAVITHDDQRVEDSQFGPDVFQNIICAFERWILQEKDFYPTIGDIIKWNDAYYDISQCIDNQLIAGRMGLPHSIICTAVMTSRSTINVRTETGENESR